MMRPVGLFSLSNPLPWAMSLTLHAGAGAVVLGDSHLSQWFNPVESKTGVIQFTVSASAPEFPQVSRSRVHEKHREPPRKSLTPQAISEPTVPGLAREAADSALAPAQPSAPAAAPTTDMLRDYASRARLRIQKELDGLDDIKKLPPQGLQLKLWLAQDGAVERLELSGDGKGVDDESLMRIRKRVKQAGPFEALPGGIPRLALKVPLRTRADRP
jgi:hypothetical protein